MKKLTIIFIAALLCCGCGKAPQQTAKDIKIGLSIPTQREERWVRDVQQLRKEAAALGVELLVKVSENDTARQLAQCEELLQQNISVLIVGPHDAAAAAEIVEQAVQKGVKVISYDRLILNADVDLYVSFDNVKVGEIQARYLTRLAPSGKYVVLSGAPTDNNAKLFRLGALNILRPLVNEGRIKIVMDRAIPDWNPAQATRLMEKALADNSGDIQAVLAPNDATAGGVIQALAMYKLAGTVPVSGQDSEAAAARRILAGTQSMTVFKDTRQLAAAAFGAAMSFAAGGEAPVNAEVSNGKINVPSLLLEPIAVDGANLHKVLVNSGYLKHEDVYRN
ncbi:MAG: ATPase [Elusimicrobia bacterium CG08_land_8_20_14_0_20_59_10]|nr:MAG: ATPase [Elusimicrobia bacterium CG08_land_8_20_14_0_20_59_10]